MFHNNWIGILALFLTCVLIWAFLSWWKKKIFTKRKELKHFKGLQNKNIQIILIIFLIGFLFYLDFIRDYVFHNLTYRMNFVELMEQGKSPYKYADYTDSWVLILTEGLSSYQVYYLKFFATLFFLAFYFFLSHIIVQITYKSNNVLPFTSLFYGLGFLSIMFAFSFYFFEFDHNLKYKFYLIAMEIGHFLESSLPTLLLLLSFKIYFTSEVPLTED